MGIITTATLIVLGVTALVGTGGAILYACTEDERAQAKIDQLEAENTQLESAKNYVEGIKTKLVQAKDYLILAKTDFKNGGHVSNNVPLANSEFISCITKLEAALTNAENLISDFDATIAQNNKDIETENSKINEG